MYLDIENMPRFIDLIWSIFRKLILIIYLVYLIA